MGRGIWENSIDKMNTREDNQNMDFNDLLTDEAIENRREACSTCEENPCVCGQYCITCGMALTLEEIEYQLGEDCKSNLRSEPLEWQCFECIEAEVK